MLLDPHSKGCVNLGTATEIEDLDLSLDLLFLKNLDIDFHLLDEMGRFMMWMATFFTMATFWKFMGFVWSTRKEKDFLQVQSEHCKRLCNDISNLENCLKAMEASPEMKVLNQNQCVHLFGKLIATMKGIDKMLSSAIEDLKFQSNLEELCYLQKKIVILGKKCIEQDQWCHSAVFQLQNKETFCELLLDLKCCYDIACETYLFYHPNQSTNIPPIQFDAATYEQVLEDGQVLKSKLEHVSQEVVSLDYEIAQHLLLRLKNLDRVDGGDLDALEVPQDFITPKLIKRIGKGGYGDVYKSNWLGLECATKVMEGNYGDLMKSRNEVGILSGLNHPNLVQFFGCGITKNVDEGPKEEEIGLMHVMVHLRKSRFFQILINLIQFFGMTEKLDESPKEDKSGEMYLVMELMETSLSQVLKKAKRPLPYHVAIDIMHQIAKGVNYLHDMQVAHLDLKPDNILTSFIPMDNLDPCRIFKVTDYGTSQLEVCNKPKPLEVLEPLERPIGSPKYMSPEMIKGSTSLYRFPADVWSFAMICSEILSGKVPYADLKSREFYDRIQGIHGQNSRPNLPDNCERLTNLIQECWSQDPLQRPTFSEICERLTNLKESFIKGGSCVLGDSKSIKNHYPRVVEELALSKDITVDLDHQLSKAKGLLKMNYIGIIGMGGIGKTTLAKAIFNDKIVNSSYHTSCFVIKCKNYQCSLEILCKILPTLGNDQKPKNLENTQAMMKELLAKKKVLLVLDDVRDETQVHDIVPIDFVQTSKGTTIILTTRQWSTIKSFVCVEGRLDVELLDEKAATKLFNTHLSWGEAPMSPNFVALRERVVQACNGLPLSLKVMGAFLREKKRLRIWERALQRLARGRNLDGDEEIWNTLQISYDGLNNDVEKGIFLDVACFFCRDVYPYGLLKEMILSMWSKDGILPMNELERLIDMSLLKVNEDGGILEMHDQLCDMGRMIARGTRIWEAFKIPINGFSSEDAKVLEGILWQGTIIKDDQNLDFKKLRILIFVTTSSNLMAHVDDLNFLLRLSSLTTLDLSGCSSLEDLPKEVGNLSSLTTLNLDGCDSLIDLPTEVGNLSSLNTLNLSECSSLTDLPKEVGNLSSLTTLVLRWCSNLKDLPKEVGNLSSLTTLNLSGCLSLTNLPAKVGNLSSLTTLNLDGCSSLKDLPKEVGNLSSLTTLDLEWCTSLKDLPKEVGNLSSLTTLNLRKCWSLKDLPKEVENLSSLTILNLRECSSLTNLPKEVGNLSFLTTFNLDGCSSLKDLPKEVGNLSSLTTLDLEWCTSLKDLPKEVGNLSSLTTLNLRKCWNLTDLPKEVENLSSLTTLNLKQCSSLKDLPKEVGNLFSLTTLNLRECLSLTNLPKEVGKLSSLTTLNLRECLSLKDLPKEVGNLSSLTTLNLRECSSLTNLPKEVGKLSSLTTLNLRECLSLTDLPKEVGNLSFLTTLNLDGCSSLKDLPKEVGKLSSLTTLDLEWCSSLKNLPKEVGNLSFLTTLNLDGCSSLKDLPKEVGNLSSLTTLNLSSCWCFTDLPKEVGNLSSLTTLDLRKCWNLTNLPKEVGNLSSLTTLNLRECSSLKDLPKEVGNLSSLTILNLSGCSSLKDLPMEVGNLSSLTTVNLNGCTSLVALPKEVENLPCLSTLDLE